jgi:hypothetical protein
MSTMIPCNGTTAMPLELFHGTNLTNLRGIRREGIKPGGVRRNWSFVDTSLGVFLSYNPRIAARWAGYTKSRKTDLVVLAMDVGRLDLRLLEPYHVHINGGVEEWIYKGVIPFDLLRVCGPKDEHPAWGRVFDIYR